MKENFYIFLDIDGVLWDWAFIKEQVKKGIIKQGAPITSFKPESIDALNFLIKSLYEQYKVNLVLSSSWQTTDMAKAISALFNSNLEVVGKIEATRNTTHKIRGVEIKEYLNGTNNNQNYVVIDDETSDIKAFVDIKKIIKTNLQNAALNLGQVKKFLINLKENKQKNLYEETNEEVVKR